eukprot:m.46358 g.46358  ORF g.46358 m.46358 type:complete len:80 (-) comp13143_c0_seq2:67-306(-)
MKLALIKMPSLVSPIKFGYCRQESTSFFRHLSKGISDVLLRNFTMTCRGFVMQLRDHTPKLVHASGKYALLIWCKTRNG